MLCCNVICQCLHIFRISHPSSKRTNDPSPLSLYNTVVSTKLIQLPEYIVSTSSLLHPGISYYGIYYGIYYGSYYGIYYVRYPPMYYAFLSTGATAVFEPIVRVRTNQFPPYLQYSTDRSNGFSAGYIVWNSSAKSRGFMMVGDGEFLLYLLNGLFYFSSSIVLYCIVLYARALSLSLSLSCTRLGGLGDGWMVDGR